MGSGARGRKGRVRCHRWAEGVGNITGVFRGECAGFGQATGRLAGRMEGREDGEQGGQADGNREIDAGAG